MKQLIFLLVIGLFFSNCDKDPVVIDTTVEANSLAEKLQEVGIKSGKLYTYVSANEADTQVDGVNPGGIRITAQPTNGISFTTAIVDELTEVKKDSIKVERDSQKLVTQVVGFLFTENGFPVWDTVLDSALTLEIGDTILEPVFNFKQGLSLVDIQIPAGTRYYTDFDTVKIELFETISFLVDSFFMDSIYTQVEVGGVDFTPNMYSGTISVGEIVPFVTQVLNPDDKSGYKVEILPAIEDAGEKITLYTKDEIPSFFAKQELGGGRLVKVKVGAEITNIDDLALRLPAWGASGSFATVNALPSMKLGFLLVSKSSHLFQGSIDDISNPTVGLGGVATDSARLNFSGVMVFGERIVSMGHEIVNPKPANGLAFTSGWSRLVFFEGAKSIVIEEGELKKFQSERRVGSIHFAIRWAGGDTSIPPSVQQGIWAQEPLFLEGSRLDLNRLYGASCSLDITKDGPFCR